MKIQFYDNEIEQLEEAVDIMNGKLDMVEKAVEEIDSVIKSR